MEYDNLPFDNDIIGTTVDVNFITTYPVYLKLWRWAIGNVMNINSLFPELQKWKDFEFGKIFNNKVNESFGADVIRLARKVYLSDKLWKETKILVNPENRPKTKAEYVIFECNLNFYYIVCSSTVVLCNFDKFKNNIFGSDSDIDVYDYLAVENPHYKSQKEDSYIRYKKGTWFVNSNIPFMAYPNGIPNDGKILTKNTNLPFYQDFLSSYFNNYIEVESEWYTGCKSVSSLEDWDYYWDFVKEDNFNIVIITGFYCYNNIFKS